MVLVSSISNLLTNKISRAIKWMRKKYLLAVIQLCLHLTQKEVLQEKMVKIFKVAKLTTESFNFAQLLRLASSARLYRSECA